MEILPFDRNNEYLIKEAAELLSVSFPHAYEHCAMEEMESILEDERIAIMAIEDDKLVGFVGAMPQYKTTGWELHPLVVKKSHQFKGIGTKLVQAIESECASKGGVTLYLGSDDEFGSTTLGNTDLYEDTYFKMENIKNIKNHPFEFYQKVGFKIVGVLPDANGIGKPDIWMAKRILK